MNTHPHAVRPATSTSPTRGSVPQRHVPLVALRAGIPPRGRVAVRAADHPAWPATHRARKTVRCGGDVDGPCLLDRLAPRGRACGLPCLLLLVLVATLIVWLDGVFGCLVLVVGTHLGLLSPPQVRAGTSAVPLAAAARAARWPIADHRERLLDLRPRAAVAAYAIRRVISRLIPNTF